jgi:transcriptional regulator with XRE-family HTH domain
MTNQITTLRERLGFTVAQCAQYLGVSTHAVIKYENNTRAPSRALVRLIGVLQTLEVMAPAIHAHMMPVEVSTSHTEAHTSPVKEGLPTD